MDFVFARVIFTLTVESDVSDPYALFKVKDGFRTAFRTAICRGDGFCEACGRKHGCSYHQTFSQSLSFDPQIIKRHQKPPLPFIFNFPVFTRGVAKGEEVEIGLVVVGRAMNYLSDYIHAVSHLFASTDGKVKGTVAKVESINCLDYRNVIREGEGAIGLQNIATISSDDLLQSMTLDFHTIVLTIETPMRLLIDGRPLHHFSFSSFARSLMRRISALASYYYGEGLEHDYKWLSSKSVEVEVPRNDVRWSGSGEGEQRFSGLIGSASCEGDLSYLHPFLLLGEYLQVGKSASFGMGRYRINKLA